ncbi:MAG TPA: hypothetical protein VLS89_06360 [Candidatus Nanopelagicales bacterium]|nr:hypothetical protein [Candidatus Nanopelagicales bacterium]
MRHLRRGVVLIGVALAGLAVPVACGVELKEESVTCPPVDVESFRLASAVLEARCGTLDCHGNSFRALRIYGRNGLRKPVILDEDGGVPADSGITADQYPDYYSGSTVDTTDAELFENALAICGLEPEKLQAFRREAARESLPAAELARELTFFRKARLQERHKGGRLWNQSDPEDKCLLEWMTATEDTLVVGDDCRTALRPRE